VVFKKNFFQERFQSSLAKCEESSVAESDQSILDEHCERVFQDGTPNQSPQRQRRQQQHQKPHRCQNVSLNSSNQFGYGHPQVRF